MATQRDLSRDTTRHRVLDAARTLFLERGFAATTIRDVAAASSASVGTVMAAGDKDGLLVQVFDRLIADEHARPRGTELGLGTVDWLLRLVEPFVTLFTAHPDLARAYAAIAVGGQRDSALFGALAEQLIEEFQAALAPSTGSPDGARGVAEALYAAYVGTLISWGGRSSGDPTELRTSLRTTFGVVCAGANS